MKKSLYFCLISIILFSCETEDETINIIDESKIENVMSLDGNQQKIAFRLLNNLERFTLWENKLIKLTGKSSNLTTNQKSIVKELLKNINPSIFIENSKENIVFNTIFYKKFYEKLIRNFSINEIKNNFFTISNRQIPNDMPNCDCNTSQGNGIYCNNISEGESYVCFDVVYDGCDSSWLGCGFLMLMSCNGMC